jgi:hypothetical protein
MVPPEGVVFRSSPTGWGYFHTLFLWAAATSATWIHYFLAWPVLSGLPGWAFLGWVPLAGVMLWLAVRLPGARPTYRLLRYLLLYAVVLVGAPMAAAQAGAGSMPQTWTATMAAGAAVVAALEGVHYLRKRKERYAVAVYPDRFDYEAPGARRTWPWDSVSLRRDERTGDYIVRGGSGQEVSLGADLRSRRRLVRLIERLSGRGPDSRGS